MLAYNNYLEEVETLTFNLLHNVDVAATESLLASHAAQNARNAGQDSASASADLSAKREAARRKEEAEKREREGDSDAAREGVQKVMLKKSTARRTAAEKAARLAAASSGAGDVFGSSNNGSATAVASDPLGYTIKGLKPISEPETERPYDAFGGLVPLTLQPPRYYTPTDTYENPWLDNARSNPAILAGGYDLREYYARAMVEAFAGLGCFVGDEKLHAQAQAAEPEKEAAAAVGTAGAAEPAGGT